MDHTKLIGCSINWFGMSFFASANANLTKANALDNPAPLNGVVKF